MADRHPEPDSPELRARWGQFAWTGDNAAKATEIVARYPAGRQRSAVMPLLDLAQRQVGAEENTQGWLPLPVIEFVAKTVSHGMRLFGNMYAGELIFMLIALMGGAFALTATGIALFVGNVVAGTVWALFHIIIITLQAFVFMMLTLVYVGQAHDSH